MTNYEIGVFTISFISLIFSVISFGVSTFSNYRQKKISQGQMEIQINQMISNTKKEVMDISLLIADRNEEILKQAFRSARELNLNAYDEACAKYLDNKVDKERFKRNYFIEIRQLVESESNAEFFSSPATPYRCIIKVYNEWNNLEV